MELITTVVVAIMATGGLYRLRSPSPLTPFYCLYAYFATHFPLYLRFARKSVEAIAITSRPTPPQIERNIGKAGCRRREKLSLSAAFIRRGLDLEFQE